MEEKTEIEIKTVKLADLTPTEKNPRKISKDDLEKLKRSVSDFPEMLDVREIVVDENLRILGGHQRVRALKENGVTEATVKIVKNWTDEQKDRFVIQDNLQNGEWDLDTLSSEWDLEKLENWGLEMPENDKFLEPDDYTEEIESDASKFMIASVTALGFEKGKVDGGQPFVVMPDYRILRLIELHPYSTNKALAQRECIKTHIGGNRIWYKDIAAKKEKE